MESKEQYLNYFRKRKLLYMICGELAIIIGDVAAYGRLNINLIRAIGISLMLVGFLLYFLPELLLKINKNYNKIDLSEIGNSNEIEELRDDIKILGLPLIIVVLLFSISLILCGTYFLVKTTGSWNKAILIFWVLNLVVDIKKFVQLKQ